MNHAATKGGSGKSAALSDRVRTLQNSKNPM
jgi:hypothetical protein